MTVATTAPYNGCQEIPFTSEEPLMFSESVMLALFGPIDTPELIIIAALGLLIFSRYDSWNKR